MKIDIRDMGYPQKRKLVSENCTPEMDGVINRESNYILAFLKAQTIMKNLNWSDDKISSAIKDTCKYGYKAYEIVYNDKQTRILDLNELEVGTLFPSWSKELGSFWVQNPLNTPSKRLLLDSQVLYLSNIHSFNNVVSLVEND